MLRRDIPEAGEVPIGYGVAWIEWRYQRLVCYPLGLHILAANLHRFWGWFKYSQYDEAAYERDIAERAKMRFDNWKAIAEGRFQSEKSCYESVIRLLREGRFD